MFLFSSLVHGMESEREDTGNKTSEEQKNEGPSFLGRCKQGIESQVSKTAQTAKAHPFVSTTLAALLGVGIYKNNERVRRTTRKAWAQVTEGVKSKLILPAYMKYLELQEYGVTKEDLLKVAALLVGGILLKKAHDKFDFGALGKTTVHKGLGWLEALWKKHPYIIVGILSGLGMSATGLYVYKTLTIPTKKRAITPMDYFLLDLHGNLRDSFKKSPQLKEFVVKGSLTALVESEAFMNFVCSLSEEQQEYVYSLINEHSETSADYGDVPEGAEQVINQAL
jgi:ribosomal protein L18